MLNVLLIRRIFEEGWSEINHKLLYKKNNLSLNEEVLLEQASSILSSLAGDCDTLGELMAHIVDRKEDVDFIKDSSDLNGHTIIQWGGSSCLFFVCIIVNLFYRMSK